MIYFLVTLIIVTVPGFLIFHFYRINRLKKDYENWDFEQEKEKENLHFINKELEEKNRYITESIEYAKKIQEAIFPRPEYVNQYLPHSFGIYKPKEIVGGDFVWFSFKDNIAFMAVVDCTGHGVPGAFLSVLGNTLLNHIVNEKDVHIPAAILGELNNEVQKALHQDTRDTEVLEGMDIALCSIEMKVENGQFVANTLNYAGSFRPLYFITKNKNGENALQEYKANKLAIGGAITIDNKPFVNHTIELKKGDSFYIFSDGVTHQFGGKKGKKLNGKRLKELLLDVQKYDMEQQKFYVEKELEQWKGNYKQTDDLLLVGIKI